MKNNEDGQVPESIESEECPDHDETGPLPSESESDDNNDDSSGGRRVIRVKDIQDRARDKYETLEPEERDEAIARDLQRSIAALSDVGASLVPIDQLQQDYANQIAEVLSRSMPKVDFTEFTAASRDLIHYESIAPLLRSISQDAIGGRLSDSVFPRGFGQSMHDALRAAEATEPGPWGAEGDGEGDPGSGSEESADDKDAATQADPTSDGELTDDVVDKAADFAAAVWGMHKHMQDQVRATNEVLETLRDHSQSIHETAESMQAQLVHAEGQATAQTKQHQESMKASRMALGWAALSAFAAGAAVIVSLFSAAPTIEVPDGYVLVPEEDAGATEVPGGSTESEGEDGP